MSRHFITIFAFFLATSIIYSQKLDKTKKNIISSIENHKSEIIKMSRTQ